MRKKAVKLMIVVLLLLVMFILDLHISIDHDLGMAGGALCISFDQWDMQHADTIVVEFRGETYTITEQPFVREFCTATGAGTMTDYCCAKQQEGSIKVYRDGRLLRTMRYVENHDAVVYDEDPTHLVLFGNEGHIFLERELFNRFRALIGLRTH